ncbi:dynein heavy chain and region D6 of dynein motor-domain-containing protein [Dunaliella salina]|uniref:Dynein heavy chain and region D6 of dynein motor-domain-containing protein n=1 Tax=Dunaliella salina TaxID=3046 RepID=A0ABQ7G560_DUNSA|nr:dynein heavy chain and region D6 of dynein motor-domain-containing protein [Dunaliella salina]|eukprot:KAF5829736.1 dynein heavy chain and region D6 of dynein motor-domain-containing protein [Dunaliella salina]
MMVPDYALIGEISLYSYGFRDGKNLARKMVATFKLCSEQLSSQDHYDYGMRAVKSVITAAGNLKRDFPSESEDVLLLRALRDVNYPKFLSHDLPLFNGIISDLFPGVIPPDVDYKVLLSGLDQACSEMNIQPAQPFVEKVIQLFETTIVRHGLMLVGPTMGGKTCCHRSLQKAMTMLNASHSDKYEKVRTVALNPKSITLGQLYGEFDDNTHEWTDGVLACYMRECSEDTKPDKKWIMFDGPVDAVWIENMNTVLDDNKKLCLVSGEIIQLSSTMTMMFEVEDLAVASPATVSRCGMVFMEPGQLGVEPLLASWLQTLPPALHAHKELLASMFRALVPEGLGFVRKSLHETVTTVDNNLVASCFNIMDALLLPWQRGVGMEPRTPNVVLPLGDTLLSWLVFCSSAHLNRIIVPTSDTVRYTYLIDCLLAAGKHILCVGETGTGKTLNVANKLLNNMPEEVVPVFLTFSARTSANQTQDMIDAKMEKKRKGVFGPPSGKKFVMFVDDLNMPQREKYFAQPPIELLRQWFDHGGWYERKPPCPFRTIIDTQFVGSMGPPGGGRNPVTNRLLRHFNFISFAEMSDQSVNRIFTTILGAFFRRYFNEEIQGMNQSLLAATIQIYNTIRTEMLPTPSKSHYTFNLRDLAKVVQGCMRADPKSTSDRKQILSLWLHECSRVFEDRLNNQADHEWFRKQQVMLLDKHFKLGYEDIVPQGRLIYGDFLIPGADPKIYKQITDMDRLVKVVEEYLEDYNSMSNAPMKLVMFLDAIEHVSRITRVMRLPLGNALLLGVGGSGRQSLTRLAAFMEDYEVYQIEVAKGYGAHEWRDDLKRVLMKCGIDGKELVFLFTDTQIVQEAFLEDINNILNSGEVPNLFQNDDLETISSAMRPLLMKDGVPVTKNAIYTLFVGRVRAYLHLVLCFSPIGDAFRQRLRMFPSLVNCCTIDWFQEWPDEALRSVAFNFYSDVELNSEAHPQLLEGVVDSCVFVHQSVERWSRVFHEQLRRSNYVTPTSYLELLGTFIRLLSDKRNEINNSRRRLEVGLQKLLSTAAQVEVMQRELKGLQPILARTSQEVDDMMVVITNDKKEADETKKTVEQQEKEANVQAANAKEIADDAQRDLDEALPALDAAVASLKNLSRNDVVEVKSLGNPPSGVKLVMEAACIMFDEKPVMVNDPNRLGKKIPNYWEPAKKLLADPGKFLESLLQYDKDNISDGIIKKVEPYILMEEFTPDAVSKVSKACTSICMWVRAMYVYHNVALQVAPKREALQNAQNELSETMKQLAEAQAKLKAVEEKMEVLQAQYMEAMGKKEGLAKQVHECTVKLQRADKLIGGLGGERIRWQATVDQLTTDLVNVVGDVVIAAGSIAYSGPFTPVFRANLLAEWTEHLHKKAVPHSEGCNLIKTLQDPVKSSNMFFSTNTIPCVNTPSHRFYMTTKLRNPHYAPEVSVKVSLLNFFVTTEGLEEQLLGTVVTQERPDLANLKSQLTVNNAKMKKELQDIEDKILHMLSNSQGNILDDEELINTLAQSKITSNEISAKVAEAEVTEKQIDETREQYRPVAVRASLLFFCISDLATVDPMYQYSLTWFISLFIRSIEEAEKSQDIKERGNNLNSYFTYALYVIVCRSLFEQHKLMFSLMLAIKILQNQNMINPQEWSRFVEPPPFDLQQSYKESAPATPLIFVLSPGADPMADLLKLADEMKFSKKFEKVSLGQGQGPKAEKLLEFGMDRGIWVCLQNCHLAVSWMPTLERIVEGIEPDKVHKDFRLWLTSMPSPDFPVTILQDGIKMTLEPPKGLKSNLLRSYNRFTDSYLMNCSKPSEWRALSFGLCLYHAVIQDRRKFGPLGWNIRYDFTDGDLNVSLAQMKEYLDLYDEIPFKVLRFLITEINYGGRVTDDKDRRLMNNLVNNFVGPDVVHPGYKFSPSGVYYTPDCTTVKDYQAHISAYPMVPRPEIFGLHDNADITCDQNETYNMFATVLSLQPRESSGQGQSQEEVIAIRAQQILDKLPRRFDVEEECHRYNGLLAVMDRSLHETVKAVKGLVVMSPELEAVTRSMYDNQVPDMWAAKAYPSLKPLSSWVNDLLDRCRFIQTWVDQGTPSVYWIPGFFFPQAFLTGTLQNYARKHSYAIDTVSFSFHIMDEIQVCPSYTITGH